MCQRRNTAVVFFGLMAAVLLWHSCTLGDGTAPRAGLVLPCEIVGWHDGDTGTVRVTIDVQVRLLDCWAPEIKGRALRDDERKLSPEKQTEILGQIAREKQRGVESLKSVSQIAPVGSRGQLEIPLAGVERSDEVFTMGRVLGRVWVGGKDVSELQVSSGHATKEKGQ